MNSVLIVSGATHNFISNNWVQELEIPISETTSCGIVMVTGKVVKGTEVFKGVVARLRKLKVAEDFVFHQIILWNYGNNDSALM